MTSLAEAISITSIGELDGYAWAVIICLYYHIEVVSLSCACSQLGVDMELALPLATAHSLRKCNLVGISAMGSFWLSWQFTPSIISKPVSECVEQCAIINGLPEVSAALIIPVHGRSIRICTIRNDCSVVVGMVLQHYVANIDIGIVLASTKVEHKLNVSDVYTRHIALPEYVILSCLQVNAICKEVDIVVILLSQFNCSTSQILIRIQYDREVVVGSGIGVQIGVECHLRLPLLSISQRQIDRPAVITLLECWVRTLTPVLICIPEGNGRCDTLPHIEVAIDIEALLLYQTLIGSTCQDKAPCNTAIRSIVDKYQLGSSQTLDAELWILVLSIA